MTILMSQGPGLPEHGGGQVQAHRLAGDEFEVRRHVLLLAAGIAATFALFLALPLMQVVSQAVQPPPIILDPPGLPLPVKFEPPPPPVTQDKPADDIPILKPDPIRVPIEDMFAPVNPFGPRVPVRGFTFNPEELIPDIFTVDQLDRPPSAIYTVAPDVPRGVREGGNVLIEFIVTPQGTVTGIRVISSSNPAFDRPAVAALAKWKFEPGVKDNTPVSTRMRLPVRFNIGN